MPADELLCVLYDALCTSPAAGRQSGQLPGTGAGAGAGAGLANQDQRATALGVKARSESMADACHYCTLLLYYLQKCITGDVGFALSCLP